MNKFQDNVQAGTAEFIFDALLKNLTKTVTLLEGGILQNDGVSKTYRTNKERK